MAKKSAAQLRRLKKRAAGRGEEYKEEPEPSDPDDEEDDSSDRDADDNTQQKPKNKSSQSASSKPADKDPEIASRLAAAEKLKSELRSIEENEELKAKDRRSGKRKAEAIAFEDTGMNADDLLKWYQTEQQKQEQQQEGGKTKNNNKTSQQDKKQQQQNHKSDPYIAFFGQLSFETTEDDLLQHIRSQLEVSYPASVKKSIQIRVLIDSKTKKSRGMAFVQVQDPEFLYALLKLHQTYLKGRRINVEKSAGGKKNSETRKAKIQAYRKEQDAYFVEVVDNILGEFRKTGEIREDELDDGVIQMCRRHTGPVVKAAITEYVEKGGNQMDNPSAYLTFLVSKFAKEGIHDEEQTGVTKKGRGNKTDNNNKRNRNSEYSTNSDTKRPKRNDWKDSSQLSMAGVDMSMSDKMMTDGDNVSNQTTNDLASIFPSSQRGKGRGYLRNVRR